MPGSPRPHIVSVDHLQIISQLNKRGAKNSTSHEDRSMMKLIVRPIKSAISETNLNCLSVGLNTSLLAGIRSWAPTPTPTHRNRMVMRLNDFLGQCHPPGAFSHIYTASDQHSISWPPYINFCCDIAQVTHSWQALCFPFAWGQSELDF